MCAGTVHILQSPQVTRGLELMQQPDAQHPGGEEEEGASLRFRAHISSTETHLKSRLVGALLEAPSQR